MSQNVLSSDLDDHMGTLLRLFQMILTSEANRPDCVFKNSVTENDPYGRDDYRETRLNYRTAIDLRLHYDAFAATV